MTTQEAVATAEKGGMYPGKSLEILHFPNCDMIINKDADRAEWAPKLAELFKDGAPQDWHMPAGETDSAAKQDGEEDDEDEIPDYKPGPKPGMAVGKVDSVTFIYKPKAFFRKRDYKETLEKYKEDGDLGFFRSLESVLSEIALSPKIKHLVASGEMQELARKYGYEGIRFVEPVMAVVYRQTGAKYLVYEYIHHVDEVFMVHLKEQALDQDEEMEKAIKDFFKRHGLLSTETGTSHLLIDENNVLNLVDAEDFRRIPTSQD